MRPDAEPAAMPQPGHVNVSFDHPANAGVLKHLRARVSLSAAAALPSCSPGSVDDPYLNLGTHPDLVARLWDEITTALPVRCNWVVYGSPVLVRPDTGILFGFAGGTHTYALRLPPAQRADLAAAALDRAVARADRSGMVGAERERYLHAQAGNVHTYGDGSTFDVTALGEGWVFGRWLADEIQWCSAAYDHARGE